MKTAGTIDRSSQALDSRGRQAADPTPFHPFCLAGGRWRRLRPLYWVCGATALLLPMLVWGEGAGLPSLSDAVLIGCMAVQAGLALFAVPLVAGVRFGAARRQGQLDDLVLTRLRPGHIARLLERGATASVWLCCLLLVPVGLGSAVLSERVPEYVILLVLAALGGQAGAHQVAVVMTVGWSLALPRGWALGIYWVASQLLCLGCVALLFLPGAESLSLTMIAGLGGLQTLLSERSGAEIPDVVMSRWPVDAETWQGIGGS